MKHLFYLPAFLALATVSVHAQDTGFGEEPSTGSDTEFQTQSEPGVTSQGAMDFSRADTDGNGELSIEEAQAALPDLIIVDINNDGVLNRSEAENALPGLTLEGEGDAGSDQPVGEAEFDQIVSAVEEQNSSQVGAVSSPGLDEEV